MCPQPPSWQAVALGLLILNSSQPHLLPSPRSTASREGRTRKVQVAPGSARLSRPAAADSGGPARDCAPAGRAPRSPLRGRCRPPPSPARGGAAPDSGLSSQGNLLRAAPRSFLSLPPRPGLGGRSTRGPGRGPSDTRPLPPRRVQKDARRPALPARRTGKVSAPRGSPEPALGRRAPATGPGRVPRGCEDPRRPGRAGSPGSGADPAEGSAGLLALEAQVMQVAVGPGSRMGATGPTLA